MSVSSAVQKTYFDNKVTAFAKHGVTTNNNIRGGVALIVKQSENYTINAQVFLVILFWELNWQFEKAMYTSFGCLFHSTNLSAEAYKSVLLEPFDLYDEICKTGPAIRCGNFNTDIINKDSSLQSKLLVDWVTERNMCNTFECDGVFSFFIILFVIITVMSSIKR